MTMTTSKSHFEDLEHVQDLTFPFETHGTLTSYRHPYQKYLQTQAATEAANPDAKTASIVWIAVGALTFHPTFSPPKILLLQRAITDSMPNLWEPPGGGCDDPDESILHSTARELYEEAGLVARSIGPAVGDGYVFPVRGGRLVRKFNFIIEIATSTTSENESMVDQGQAKPREVEVKLDPGEHQAYVWATKEDILAGKVGNVDIEITTKDQKDVILKAFDVREKR